MMAHHVEGLVLKPVSRTVWLLLALFTGSLAAQGPTSLEARKILYPGGKPEFAPWQSYPVRTLQQLHLPAADPQDKNLDRFGGRSDRSAPATGFFYTTQVAGRWWMVDPLGHLYLNSAIVDLLPGPSDGSAKALKATFNSTAEWMRRTHQMLLDNGIHGAGGWLAVNLLRQSPLQATQPIAYSINLDVMAAYGRHRGGVYRVAGHQAYPQDTIFIFDPEFPAFADKYLARIDAYRDDPNLMGYFSDNEIPLYRKNLDGFLSLPDADPGHIAAAAWMKDHGAEHPTDDLRTEFLEFEADRYFQLVTAAILKHDPHHMYLGCRFTAQQLVEPTLFRSVGRFASAVSVNYYSDWQPSPATMTMWEKEAHKPFMITEFYVKGEDSGLGNTTGAGWLVRTQADRGIFYQNFVLALLESGKCVGWDWFKYQDNDPLYTQADPSNLDSNKGIVDVNYRPYVPLLAAMQALNLRLYQVADFFAAPRHPGKR